MRDSSLRRYHRPVIAIVLGINIIFWAWFWIEVVSALVPYQRTPVTFEYDPPSFVWFGYAVPPSEQYDFLPFWLMDRVQMPANLLSRYAIWGLLDWRASGEYIFRGETFAGTSPVGYIVFSTMIVSFVQWYVVGRVLSWLASKLAHSQVR